MKPHFNLGKFIRGPGWETSDIESNRIIGENQALKALELYTSESIEVEGTVDFVQRYWDITKTIVTNNDVQSKMCVAAMVRYIRSSRYHGINDSFRATLLVSVLSFFF